MTQLTPLDLVLDTLQLVVASPEHRPTQLAARFSADYRQQVDGKVLNFEQFEQHMALLKRQTRRMTLKVLAAAAAGRGGADPPSGRAGKARWRLQPRAGAGALHRA